MASNRQHVSNPKYFTVNCCVETIGVSSVKAHNSLTLKCSRSLKLKIRNTFVVTLFNNG